MLRRDVRSEARFMSVQNVLHAGYILFFHVQIATIVYDHICNGYAPYRKRNQQIKDNNKNEKKKELK